MKHAARGDPTIVFHKLPSYNSSDGNSQVGKGGLPPLKIRSHSRNELAIQVEWLRILSGGNTALPNLRIFVP